MSAEGNARRWDALARMVGYNELAKGAKTLGEKVYLRMGRDEARKAYERLGGTVDDSGPEPAVVVQTRPPFVVMSDADVELMREAVAAHDAARRPSVVVVEAPGDACGNTGRLPGGGRCPGCRACS